MNSSFLLSMVSKLILEDYTLEDLILSAIKAEQDSERAYNQIAGQINNAFFEGKLKFLAGEERKHKLLLEKMFREKFPERDIRIPDKSPVPLPEIFIPDENFSITAIIESAMRAEQAARDFYLSLKGMFPAGSSFSHMLAQLAAMERAHYILLEVEANNMALIEEFDDLY